MADRRQGVLDTLKSAERPMSIAELADRVQVHPNTVRFHLEILVREGRVDQVEHEPVLPGRPPLMFRAVRAMDPSGPRNYQALANALATRMSAESDARGQAIRAGDEWGRRLGVEANSHAANHGSPAADRLLVILDDLGFSPARSANPDHPQIELHHCPFLDLIPKHQDVICAMHLGLMQGALTEMGAATSVERLEPFAEPDLCIAHMSSLVEAS